MAKIRASGNGGEKTKVHIEGRLQDAAVLLTCILHEFGALVRATAEREGAGDLPPDNVTLAMMSMHSAGQVRLEASKEDEKEADVVVVH